MCQEELVVYTPKNVQSKRAVTVEAIDNSNLTGPNGYNSCCGSVKMHDKATETGKRKAQRHREEAVARPQHNVRTLRISEAAQATNSGETRTRDAVAAATEGACELTRKRGREMRCHIERPSQIELKTRHATPAPNALARRESSSQCPPPARGGHGCGHLLGRQNVGMATIGRERWTQPRGRSLSFWVCTQRYSGHWVRERMRAPATACVGESRSVWVLRDPMYRRASVRGIKTAAVGPLHSPPFSRVRGRLDGLL